MDKESDVFKLVIHAMSKMDQPLTLNQINDNIAAGLKRPVQMKPTIKRILEMGLKYKFVTKVGKLNYKLIQPFIASLEEATKDFPLPTRMMQSTEEESNKLNRISSSTIMDGSMYDSRSRSKIRRSKSRTQRSRSRRSKSRKSISRRSRSRRYSGVRNSAFTSGNRRSEVVELRATRSKSSRSRRRRSRSGRSSRSHQRRTRRSRSRRSRSYRSR